MKQPSNARLLNVLLVLALIVLGLFSIKSCNKNKTLAAEAAAMLNYKDTVMYYKSKTGDLIAYNHSLVVSHSNLKVTNKLLAKELEELKMKKPVTVTSVLTEVVVNEVMIPYEVKLPCDSFDVALKYTDPWLSINGRSKHTGITLDSIRLVNDMLIAVGEKNNGFFRRNEHIVAVKSENPYFNITSLQSYTFKPKEPFYDRWWFKASIFTAGFVVGTQIK
jgi:hypothetical protein